MPKNIEAAKSKMKPKSTRRPLQDVSNSKIAVKSANVFKKPSEGDGEQTGGDSLDRLLLVHSDLSSLLRQIDELVVQALQLTSNEGRKEIKQFADVLSDMQTSLKPWVPRFQKALSSQSTEPENRSEQPVDQIVVCVSKETKNTITESPEQTKWESLVSPSPLVSWRAECNTEGGRQLFLLTPLPQTKTFSSKFKASSITAFDKTTLEEITHPVSLFNSVGNLPEGVSAKPPAHKVSHIEVNNAVDNPETMCASPAKYSKPSCPMFVMTPCLKMSPPKSCILLEPVSEFSRRKNQGVHRSTPFPTGVQNSNSGKSTDSESSSTQSSDDLKVKYPELYGISLHQVGNRMVAEDSPNWIVSPPKTCVIMEPPDEKLPQNPAGNLLLAKTTALQNVLDISDTLYLAECTPMVKEPTSSFRMGKHPGENTLKKELWTKFEAASTHVIRFNESILQNTCKKGFLDRLEEASDA